MNHLGRCQNLSTARMALYDALGRRLYTTALERESLLQNALSISRDHYLLCATLAWSGCRLSEALNLTPANLDTGYGALIIESLKKRVKGHFRAVPIPDWLIAQLVAAGATDRFWPVGRSTGWRMVKAAMMAGRVTGPAACPKGLRHGFGVAAIQSGVPLNLVQKWLGHSRMSTTAIYANAIGDEERQIASRMWLAGQT